MLGVAGWALAFLGAGCRSDAGGAARADAHPRGDTASDSVSARGIETLRWLVGEWRAVTPDGTFEESWSEPDGPRMTGRGRFVRDGRELFFETLAVEARGDVLVYLASPNGRGPTEFASTQLEPGVARFENPRHDDPKVIDYRLLPDGTLQVQVIGAGTQTFAFSRAR